MIKIEIECATGAEARQQLVDLLYGEQSAINTLKNEPKISEAKMAVLQDEKPVDEKIAEDAKALEENYDAPKSQVDIDKKKRRTKAEIEAEKKVAEFNNAPAEEGMIPEGGDIQMEEAAIDVKVLQNKAVELGRVGKRELVKAVLAKFGAEAFTAQPKPLDPKHYAECLTELEKL